MTHPFDTLEPDSLRLPFVRKWMQYPQDVLPLWIADMDFPVAPAILEAIANRAKDSLNYPLADGDPDFFGTLLSYLSSYGFDFGPPNIWLMTGVVPGLFCAVKAFSSVGDPVITQVPIYPPFLMAINENERVVLENPLKVGSCGYELDLQALEGQLTPRTKLLMFCNPHNPTGRVWTRAELERVAEFAIRHDLIVISDDLHAQLDFTKSYLPLASLSDEIAQRTVTLIGPGKAYNTAGLGAGAAFSHNPQLMKKMRDAGHGFMSAPAVTSQAAWGAALAHCGDWLKDTMTYLEGNRDFITEFMALELPQVGYFASEGSYLTLLDFRSTLGEHAAKILLEEGKVGLNEGSTFGPNYKGYARLNFATSRAILTEALQRIAGVVRSRG